eukprot:695656-Amphidinium_carterae.1
MAYKLAVYGGAIALPKLSPDGEEVDIHFVRAADYDHDSHGNAVHIVVDRICRQMSWRLWQLACCRRAVWCECNKALR